MVKAVRTRTMSAGPVNALASASRLACEEIHHPSSGRDSRIGVDRVIEAASQQVTPPCGQCALYAVARLSTPQDVAPLYGGG